MGAPVVRTRGSARFMSPGDFPVSEMYVLKVGEAGLGRILAVVHVVLYLDDRGVGQKSCVVKLLIAFD